MPGDRSFALLRATTQQHHLDTLALLGMPFPMQRCFQTPDLLFGAFDHLFLRIWLATW
jgi:hypothetical protein